MPAVLQHGLGQIQQVPSDAQHRPFQVQTPRQEVEQGLESAARGRVAVQDPARGERELYIERFAQHARFEQGLDQAQRPHVPDHRHGVGTRFPDALRERAQGPDGIGIGPVVEHEVSLARVVHRQICRDQIQGGQVGSGFGLAPHLGHVRQAYADVGRDASAQRGQKHQVRRGAQGARDLAIQRGVGRGGAAVRVSGVKVRDTRALVAAGGRGGGNLVRSEGHVRVAVAGRVLVQPHVDDDFVHRR